MFGSIYRASTDREVRTEMCVAVTLLQRIFAFKFRARVYPAGGSERTNKGLRAVHRYHIDCATS